MSYREGRYLSLIFFARSAAADCRAPTDRQVTPIFLLTQRYSQDPTEYLTEIAASLLGSRSSQRHIEDKLVHEDAHHPRNMGLLLKSCSTPLAV